MGFFLFFCCFVQSQSKILSELQQRKMREMRNVLIWILICIFLSVTVLFFWCVCREGQRYQVPVIYYTNLIICVLIHHSMTFFWEMIMHDIIACFFYYFAVTASLYFKSCIALERYCFIACPLLDCLRQTEGSVLVCVLVWVLCSVSVALAVFLYEFPSIHPSSSALSEVGSRGQQPKQRSPDLPLPSHLLQLIRGNTKAFPGQPRDIISPAPLPAATSVPTEEKRRTVGTLVLLLLNYFLINLPAVTLLTLNFETRFPVKTIDFIIMILFLFSSLLDFILFIFMCKGPIDRLLAHLCCCSMESNNTGDVTDVSTDRSDHVVRDEGKEETGSHDGRDGEEVESVR
ncbi:carboxypeptidase N regulatory subunit [Sarotherodon galilaeus]